MDWGNFVDAVYNSFASAIALALIVGFLFLLWVMFKWFSLAFITVAIFTYYMTYPVGWRK